MFITNVACRGSVQSNWTEKLWESVGWNRSIHLVAGTLSGPMFFWHMAFLATFFLETVLCSSFGQHSSLKKNLQLGSG